MIINRGFLSTAVAFAACVLAGSGATTPALAQAPAQEPSAAPTAEQRATAAQLTTELSFVKTDSFPSTAPHRRTALAVGEIVGLNTLIWSYDRFIRQGGENPGFRMGFNSWQENLNNGFEWDDNNFATNQFAHPYHGSMYYNAARSNGYGFWGSVPFVFAGSYMWEHFYETHHPSYNDFVNTSLGGVALGEMLWRLSDMAIDNTATGSSRTWHEIGAMAVNPVRGLTRLFTGEWSKVGPNPEGRFPSRAAMQLDFGARNAGEGNEFDADSTKVFVSLQGLYGDPFNGDYKKPFDSIDLNAQINFNDASALAGLGAHGLLAATELSQSEGAHHLLGFFMNFDYANTFAYEVGQQSVGAALLSRFHDTALGTIETQVHLNGIILAGVEADYESFTGREYDYGPGASAVVSAAFLRNNWPLLSIRHGQHWVHTLNGTPGEHHLSITRVRLDVPVTTGFGLGAQYLLYLADNDYEDYPDTYRRLPEVRAYASLPLH